MAANTKTKVAAAIFISVISKLLIVIQYFKSPLATFLPFQLQFILPVVNIFSKENKHVGKKTYLHKKNRPPQEGGFFMYHKYKLKFCVSTCTSLTCCTCKGISISYTHRRSAVINRTRTAVNSNLI